MSTSGETTTNSEGERKEAEEGEKPRVRALKKEEGKTTTIPGTRWKRSRRHRGRQTGGDWNGVFPRRVLLLVSFFNEVFEDEERTTRHAESTHVNAVGEFNHGEFSRVHERQLTLPILDGRGEDASGVEDAETTRHRRRGRRERKRRWGA